jgi:ABC-type antimicrobial peptide transport system permease subunit
MRLRRSHFTVLAAVAAAAAVLFFGLSLREGIARDLRDVLARWGADVLFVCTGEPLTAETLDGLEAHPAIAEVAVEGSTSLSIHPGDAFHITWIDVSRNHPDVVGVPLAEGRAFGATERNVAILGAEVKRVVFGDEDAIGRRLEGVEIVGVLAEIPADDSVREKYNRLVLKPFGVSGESKWGRLPERGCLYVRASGSISGAEGAIRSLVPGLLTLLPMSERYAGPFHYLRLLTRVLLLSGLATAFVAAVLSGGLLTLSTLRRRREIGIRLAAGAAGRDVLRLVVGEGMAIALVGTLVGAALGALAAAALEGVVYMSIWHALLPVGAVVLSLVAALGPGLAAARQSPVRLLGRRGLLETRSTAHAIGAFVVSAFAVATGAAILVANLSVGSYTFIDSLWGDIDARTLLVEEPRESILAQRDLDLQDATAFDDLEGVELVVPYLVGMFRTGESEWLDAMAIDAEYVDLRLLHIEAGRDLASEDFAADARRCLLDSLAAERLGLSVGDELLVGSARFEIVGIFGAGPVPRVISYDVIVPLRYAGAVNGILAEFLVRVAPGADVGAVGASIRSAFSERYPGYAEVSVFSVNARAAELGTFLLDANLRLAITAFALLLLAILEANTHGRFILNQRRAELGVRRCIGASPVRVALSAWREAALLATLGTALGAVAGHLAVGGVLDWFYSLERPPIVVTLVSAAVTLSLIAALGALPVRSVIAATPSDLLRRGRV